ncbi:MAG: hypothetical protein J5802_07230 [Butyrivibrio sp.]|nr:hypothetical protein [Butyrivibrio sp.]
MTSANLSWGDKIKANRKSMGKRRLWAYVLVLPAMAVAFVVPLLLYLLRAINYANDYAQTREVLLYEKQWSVLRIIGFDSPLIAVVGLMGVIYAFMGFSYLFSKSKLDFYLSLPTTSARRVLNAFAVALSNFTCILLAVEIAAILVAAIFGALSGPVLIAVLIQTIRMLVFFYACFTMTTLAIMLCGTRIIAILMAAFLLCITCVFSLEMYGLKRVFFVTFSRKSIPSPFLSPVYDAYTGYTGSLDALKLYDRAPYKMADIMSTYMNNVFACDMDMIFTAVLATVAVYFIYKHRRAEHIGKTVILRPVRWVLKVIGCIVTSLAGMIVIYILYSKVWNHSLYIVLCVAMLVICILMGCLIEIVLDANVKSFSKGKSQTLMALAILLLIFFIYRGDLIGYDCYVPKASSVEYCALYTHEPYGYYSMYDETRTRYIKNNMRVKDVEPFLQMARVSMDYSRSKREAKRPSGWPMTLTYKLKNGKTVYRNVTIPYDIDPDLMDKVTSSDEFKKGYVPCFGDIIASENVDLYFETRSEYKVLLRIDPQEFLECYRQDVMENYKFSSLKNGRYVGRVEITADMIDRFDTYEYPLGENYSHTIEYLKKYNIYPKSFDIDLDKVTEVNITNNWPGYDFDSNTDEEVADMYNGIHSYDFTEKNYTDKEQLKEIVSNVDSSYSDGDWAYIYDKDEVQYWMSMKCKDNYGGESYVNCNFLRHKVPQFVKEDLNN